MIYGRLSLERACSRLVAAIKLIDMGKTVNCMKRAWKIVCCLFICQGDSASSENIKVELKRLKC